MCHGFARNSSTTIAICLATFNYSGGYIIRREGHKKTLHCIMRSSPRLTNMFHHPPGRSEQVLALALVRL
jgi:hypothetical protein